METEHIVTETEEPIIPIDHEMRRFSKSLSVQKRLIFSARFGDGKSYFLNRFFRERLDEYCCITVYPVNYQVEENKDIFELIKRDILIQLLANDLIQGDETVLDEGIIAQYYLFNNGSDILLDLLSSVPLIKTPAELIKRAIKHFEGFKEYKNAARKTDPDNVREYLQIFSNASGICEYDSYSELITRCIRRIREEEGREVVLLVEDLDRMDPGHIFRILNILSVHLDRSYISGYGEKCEPQDNKFGFDKVVTVCHYENIRKIFHHLYGPETDFTGYIQKFSTSEVFSYSLKNVLLEQLFQRIKDKDISEHEEYFLFILKKTLERREKPNLRKIMDVFDNDFPEIKGRYFKETKISTSNPFMKFIVVAERLEYDFNELFNHLVDNNSKARGFIEFISTNWCLMASEKGKISFNNMYIMVTNPDSLDHSVRETYDPHYIRTDITLLGELQKKVSELREKCMDYIHY